MSVTYSRCQSCLGSKKMLGKGLFTVDCWHCYGTGQIQHAVDEVKFVEKIAESNHEEALEEVLEESNANKYVPPSIRSIRKNKASKNAS